MAKRFVVYRYRDGTRAAVPEAESDDEARAVQYAYRTAGADRVVVVDRRTGHEVYDYQRVETLTDLFSSLRGEQ